MTIPEMRTLLEGVNGYSDKVAYWQWEVGAAPSLPFICFFTTEPTPFAADNKTYFQRDVFKVELYTKFKDISQEALIEEAFNNNDLYFTKESDYLDDEDVWEVIYTVGG